MAEDFQEQVHSLQGFEIRKKRENVFIYELALTQSLKVHSKSCKCSCKCSCLLRVRFT